MKLLLSLFANNLPSGITSKPDPYAIITLLHKEDKKKPDVIGQTEVLYQTTSPYWTKRIVLPVDYNLGSTISIVVSLYDHKNETNEKKPIGSVLYDIGTVLGCKNCTQAKQMKPDSEGVIGLLVTEMDIESSSPTAAVALLGTLCLQIQAKNLPNKDGLGMGLNKSDPFYQIQRLLRTPRNDKAMWETIYRSYPLTNNLNPLWPEVYLDVALLVNVMSHSKDEKLRILICDDDDTENEILGEVQVTLNQLLASTPHRALVLKDSSKNMENSGQLYVLKAVIEGATDAAPSHNSDEGFEIRMDTIDINESKPQVHENEPGIVLTLDDGDHNDDENNTNVPDDVHPTFLQYVNGGCEIRVVIAIDATASNGNPRDPNSLHYFDDSNRNDYEGALYSICTILSKYDSDQKYPIYGFGMKPRNSNNNGQDGSVHHCYQFGDQDADGVDGILQLYRSTFRSGLIMSSPRQFASVIQKAGSDAIANFEQQQNLSYTILLLFTNGSPNDLNETLQAIHDVDDKPLSIIVVGVGEDNDQQQFHTIRMVQAKSMDSTNDETGLRDKIRFVHFDAEFKNDNDKLTSAALDAIPKQLESYFYQRHILPKDNVSEDNSNSTSDISVEPYNAHDDIVVPMNINDDTGEVVVTENIKPPPPQPVVKLSQRPIIKKIKHVSHQAIRCMGMNPEAIRLRKKLMKNFKTKLEKVLS